jgi:hypothetical protein
VSRNVSRVGAAGGSLSVQQVTGDLGQYSKRSQHGDQGSAPSHLDQIRAHERMPSRLGVGLGDDCQLIGDVEDGERLVG